MAAVVPVAARRRRDYYRKRIRESRDPYIKFMYVCDWLYNTAKADGRIKEVQREILRMVDDRPTEPRRETSR
jgi:hypothetical protein